jgi:hypothetical protein
LPDDVPAFAVSTTSGFRRADIARVRLPRFDRSVSRFGLMFVEDVPATRRHLHASLKPGGRIALAV